MEQRRWKASWYDRDLNYHEYVFDAPDNRAIAGIDFRLKLIDQGRPIPEHFELEEGRQINRIVPSLADVARREQK